MDEAATTTSRRARITSVLPRRVISTPTARSILNDHTPGEAVDQIHVFTFQRRAQIGVGRGPAAAIVDGLLHGAEAFLLRAIVVVGNFEARLLSGGDEGVE